MCPGDLALLGIPSKCWVQLATADTRIFNPLLGTRKSRYLWAFSAELSLHYASG
jgi:hypothetical protein